MSAKDNQVYLSAGDVELNRLLAADRADGGLRVGRVNRDGRLNETSIILIEGGAGLGKTTLALQIANAVVNSDPPDWGVVFLTLEQPAESLLNVVENFRFEGLDPKKVFVDLAAGGPSVPAKGKVLLSRLSPLPLSDRNAEVTFETRFAELEYTIKEQAAIRGAELSRTFYVIDSLNAFTGTPLSRSQLYQLFALFRAQHIPLLVTLEQADKKYAAAYPQFETASFLADIVIELTREQRHDYLQFFLEVSKSRVCRLGLGKHLYKTRTLENAKDVGAPRRTGLVVYPSVHFIISQARRSRDNRHKREFEVAPELVPLLLEPNIESPACFAVQGPAGTHKLALGLNLGVSYVGHRAKLLVITFGGQGEIDFPGVAWMQSQGYLRKLARAASVKSPPGHGSAEGTKAQVTKFEASDPKSHKHAEVTVLTFQIGVLTPEECLHRIRQVLEDLEGKNDPFQSVLISDTVELCTGFPLLSKDPMFFAALLDLFEAKGLLTVGIGVQGSDDSHLREMNLALGARASHRMVLWHFPGVENLMAGMVERGRFQVPPAKSPEPPPLQEQLVAVVIDNVTGKHYKRQPRWIWVEEDEHTKNKPKVLHCEPFDDPPIESNPAKLDKPKKKRAH